MANLVELRSQHQSNPDAPARVLLLAIERDPERMRQLLAEPAA